jgi:hypothetical protein
VPVTSDGESASALDPSTWSPLDLVQAAQRAGSSDGVGIMAGPLGDGSMLVALRLTWCLDDGDGIAWWVRPFLPVLEETWTKIDATGRGYQALLKIADADLTWLSRVTHHGPGVRFWRTIGGKRRPGVAELWAGPRFLPMTGVVMGGWNYVNEKGWWHQAAPPDLTALDRKALERALAPAFADIACVARVARCLRGGERRRGGTVVPLPAPSLR